ncbi:MAG: GTP cyclohydrolase II [Arenicella sp.]
MATIRSKVPIQVGQNSDIPAQLYSFDGLSDDKEHIAIFFPAADKAAIPLVRMHSECLTGDVFNSSRCDCGNQLNEAVTKISAVGGVIVYLRQEGRGIGLYPKIDAYALQDKGYDTYEANEKLGYDEDSRCFSVAGEMLKAMEVTKVRLLTNNPQKEELLRASGIEIIETLRTGVYKKHDNIDYLKSKVAKKDHKLDVD